MSSGVWGGGGLGGVGGGLGSGGGGLGAGGSLGGGATGIGGQNGVVNGMGGQGTGNRNQTVLNPYRSRGFGYQPSRIETPSKAESNSGKVYDILSKKVFLSDRNV